MKRCIPPILKTYTADDLFETMGPTQMASIDLDLYRGTMLKDYSKQETRFVKQEMGGKYIVVHLDKNADSLRA